MLSLPRGFPAAETRSCGVQQLQRGTRGTLPYGHGCHGSTHAIYPAVNPYGRHRDNIQPMQYSGTPYTIGANMTCAVCHTREMEHPIHHENMLRMVRNKME